MSSLVVGPLGNVTVVVPAAGSIAAPGWMRRQSRRIAGLDGAGAQDYSAERAEGR